MASTMIFRFALILFLVVSMPLCAEGKRKKKLKGGAVPDPDTIVFTSEEDKKQKLEELKQRAMDAKQDKAKQDRQKIKLAVEEDGLRKGVLRAVASFGEISKEKAASLHKLGRNLYLQDRYEETFELSQEISRIHGVIDGTDSAEYADALGNVGSVANRMKEIRLCEAAMKRQLRILLDKHGPAAKEVLIQRARMLSFKIFDGETSEGISQEDFEVRMEEVEAMRERERELIEGEL